MSAFPGSPRTLQGALVAIDPLLPIPNVILFQYNPHTLTRQLARLAERVQQAEASLPGPANERPPHY